MCNMINHYANVCYIKLYTCECGQTIMGWTNLKTLSIKGKPFRCQKCGATFASQDGRKKHARNIRTYFISSL